MPKKKAGQGRHSDVTQHAHEKAAEHIQEGWSYFTAYQDLKGEGEPQLFPLAMAESSFKEALKLTFECSCSRDSYMGLGMVMLDAGLYDSAEELLDKAYQRAQSVVDQHLEESKELEDYDDDLKQMMEIVRGQGFALFFQGKYHQALKAFQHVVGEFGVDDAYHSLIMIASIHHLLGQVDDAVESYAEAREYAEGESIAHERGHHIDPVLPMSYGLALFEKGKLAEAVFQFRRSMMFDTVVAISLLRHIADLDLAEEVEDSPAAKRYCANFGALWARQTKALEFLRLVFLNEKVKRERGQVLEMMKNIIVSGPPESRREMKGLGVKYQKLMKYLQDSRMEETNADIAREVIQVFQGGSPGFASGQSTSQ
jgi:tetratricopeptide (TPR) repeat protein